MKNVNIIRSATFEGMADDSGFPTVAYQRYYEVLSRHVKTIVTGFLYISEQGRAMHPGQAGMDTPEKARAFLPVTQAVHKNGGQIIAQIAHVGRQTTRANAVGVSAKPSSYFGVSPHVLSTTEIKTIVETFAGAAGYAQDAGFDEVQIHCAHGYLIHQFLLTSINDRNDIYGDPHRFLSEVVTAVRKRCGREFAIWVKISADVDIQNDSPPEFVRLISTLDSLPVDAIEISRGTMDLALNIFRGSVPLKTALRHNPVYAAKSFCYKLFILPFVRMKMKGFKPCYNLEYAKLAQQYTNIPVICVGGFRSGREIMDAGIENISLCRPFICEPDFLDKLQKDPAYQSKCLNCNICAVMVDTDKPLRCYGGKSQ